jgi:type II secretory pathway pseudopilin PulG
MDDTMTPGTDRRQQPRRDRALYRDAGRAQREAMRRLNALPLTAKDMDRYRIVATVITQVGSYSQVSDEVRRAEVADQFDVSTRTVSRALEWAARHGVVAWAPGRAGAAWRLTLPIDPWTGDAGICPGVDPAPLDSSGAHLSRGGGQDTRGSVHTSEVSEEKSEKNPPSPPDRDARPALTGQGWSAAPLTIEQVVAGLPVEPAERPGVTAHVARLVSAGLPVEAVSAVTTPRLKTAHRPVSVIRFRLTAIEGMTPPQVWSWMQEQRLVGRAAPIPHWAWEQEQGTWSTAKAT